MIKIFFQKNKKSLQRFPTLVDYIIVSATKQHYLIFKFISDEKDILFPIRNKHSIWCL